MGSNNFFSKLASYDPLAQALHLPGANGYMKSQASSAAGQSSNNAGPYAGVTPTLSAAAAGYQPGGAGSNAGWQPFQMPTVGSGWQRFAGSLQNDPLAHAVGAPGAQNGVPGQMPAAPAQPAQNAYVAAARGAMPQQQRQVW